MERIKPARKLDKRIVRSRKAIMDAFERLLMKEPLASITVSGIAREAGIDRKTFYQHFGTVDGLLDAVAEQAVDRIIEDVEREVGELKGSDPSRVGEFARALFSSLNRAILDNLLLNRRLIENVPVDEFMTRVRKPLEQQVIERGLVPKEVRTELFDYYLAFILSGIIGIYRSWSLSDGSVPIDKVSEVANGLTLYGLSSLESLRS